MNTPKISIVIPYRDRVDNLRLALQALADQTLDAREFEVVVGVIEHSERYLQVCREYADRVNIVSVLSARPWQVGYARNLAMRQATGEVVMLMDVDMVLPPNCLRRLYDRHFAYGQRVCVVGQMIDYDNNTGDVTEVDVQPYRHYRKILAELDAEDQVRADPRITTPHVIPWAYAWTALIALPADVITSHDLTFDLGFHGYGVEDLEWAYRVCRSGTPIVMGHDFFGVHLPHVRSVAANKRTEAPNYRYFLRKWPRLDVELACALGDFEANASYLDFVGEVHRAGGGPGASLAVVHGVVDGQHTLAIGATTGATVQDTATGTAGHGAGTGAALRDAGTDMAGHGAGTGAALRGAGTDMAGRGAGTGAALREAGTGAAGCGGGGRWRRPADPEVDAVFGPDCPVEVLPITGVCLPFDDGSIDRCRILPAVTRLAPRYRDLVIAEARRVSGASASGLGLAT